MAGTEGNDGRGPVGVLIHDLRNEVNVIGFACSALRHQVKNASPEVLRSLDRIEASYARCAEMLVGFKGGDGQSASGETAG